ncbi:MAG: DegT/DnrJ/EryC1/StrS family aminotransferase [Holophaga sp.]|nr:DegT/DnrJ/EryC1/StrS family aminotransferase [Holophaga sp.]
MAQKHGIPVIEDACQSLGAKGWGKSAGQFGDMTGCSFYPTKNLGAFGDAGLLPSGMTKTGRQGAAHASSRHGTGLRSPRSGHELGAWMSSRRWCCAPSCPCWKLACRSSQACPLVMLDRPRPPSRPMSSSCPAKPCPRPPHLQPVHRAGEAGPARCAPGAPPGPGHRLRRFYPISLHEQPCFAYLGYKTGQLAETELAPRKF